MAKKKPADIGNESTAEVYRATAEERLATLENLYLHGFYTLAIYTAGVAVESIFRAYRCKIDPEFDSRHNLSEMAKAARFVEIVPVERVPSYKIALAALVIRWSNNHRFRSDAAMRALFRRSQLNRGIRGDVLKENARLAINAAAVVVNIGIKRWKP